MHWTFNDGGRAAAGFKGTTGDCAVRALAIACELPYQAVYDELNAIATDERPPRGRKQSNARTGVWPSTVQKFLARRGWKWTPSMGIGTGCMTHCRVEELPAGRAVLRLSRHYAASIDGVVHDNHDSTRGGTRCVYGYWTKTGVV